MERDRMTNYGSFGNRIDELPTSPTTGIDYLGIVQELSEENKMIEEITAKSEQTGQIVDAGQLKEVAPNANFSGNISLTSRIESAEVSQEDLSVAKSILAKSFVEIGKNAPDRCGDGRGEINTEKMSDIELLQRPVGPQAMGASQSYALARRMVDGNEESATLENDLLSMRSTILATGSELGLHTDNHEHEHGKIGCGAMNGVEAGILIYGTDDDSGAVELATAIVGSDYDKDAHESHKNVAVNLPKTYVRDNQELLDSLEKVVGMGAKQVYIDNHLEGLVSLNQVAGTVFAREYYNRQCQKQLGKTIQVFNVDVWRFSVIAEELYPSDTAKQKAYITACADWNARPAIMLSDGSQQVVVRTPKN